MEQMKQKEWSKLYASTRIAPLPAHSKPQKSFCLEALALRESLDAEGGNTSLKCRFVPA